MLKSRYLIIYHTGLSGFCNENMQEIHQLAAVDSFSCATEQYPVERGQSVG